MTRRPKILFFSEAVTLAHVSRPLAFSDALDPLKYDIHFACAYRYENYFNHRQYTYWPIESISYDAFISSASGDKSAYDDEQLESYIAEENALFKDIKPDLIVNDTRYTMCVSAPAAKIPVVNITNSYWSPYRVHKTFPIPAYKRSALYNMFPPAIAEKILPLSLVKFTYPLLQPYYQSQFLAPFNRARRRRGLSSLGSFEALHTYGDWTLYCDIADLVPINNMPSTHRFLGPLLWSPPQAPVVPNMDPSKPVVYFSLGSSNDVPKCREIVESLAETDIQMLVATAGRFSFPSSDKIYVTDFIPGLEASKMSRLVICSGGSTAAYQALSAGTPVLGLPSNSDQHQSMAAIERLGAGLSIRADQSTPANVTAAVQKILSEPLFKTRAWELQKKFSDYDARRNFVEFIGEVLPSPDRVTLPPDIFQTLPEILRRRAQETPGLPAFWNFEARKKGESLLSYRDVFEKAGKLAAAMRSMGLQKGQRVGFLAGVDPGWELMNLAVLMAGGVVVGLDSHDVPSRVENAAGQSDIRAWVCQDGDTLSRWTNLFQNKPLFIILLKEISVSRAEESIFTLNEIFNRPAVGLSSDSRPGPDDLATIIFTSGTTGEPKGVAYTHRQLIHAVRAIGRAFRDLPEGFQSICWLPLSNLFQRIVNISALHRGAVINFIPHPNQLQESLAVIKPEILIGVPRFYEKLESGIRKYVDTRSSIEQQIFYGCLEFCSRYRTARHNQNPLRLIFWPLFIFSDELAAAKIRKRFGDRLRYFVSGAAPLNPKTIGFFWGLGIPVLEAYGTSENAIPIAMNRPRVFSFGTAGQPLSPNEVKLSAEQEVLVKGPSVFAGYWKQEQSAALLFEGAYYKTGDEGRWERGGFLKLLGRRSEFIKTSTGRRLIPGPIEQHFKEIPFVDQAVVLGSQRKGPALLATIDIKSLVKDKDEKSGEAWEMTPGLQEHVAGLLKNHALKLPKLSQPLGILVFNRAFSVVRGEMTANLKLRRRAIEENYKSVLDDLFLKCSEDAGPLVWFFSAADVRMREFSTFPTIRKLKSNVASRWLVVAGFGLGALRSYIRYAWDLFREPWEFKKFQLALVDDLVISFRNTVGPLKGPLIKIGQTLSYVDAGLPPSTQKFLKELQYKSPPLSGKEIRQVFRKSLGRNPEELFDDWQDVPLASASISQIHLARLKNGRRVVVKVRYPGIDKIIESDLFAVKMFLPLIAKATGVDNINENFEEGRKLLLGECDFVREADYMKRFRDIFKDHPRIAIPDIYPQYCSKEVLTMDYVDGQSYEEFKATASKTDIDSAGEAIIEMQTISCLRHGIFQADPHPGNYLFKDGKVFFIDFGFCKDWPPEFIRQWKRQILAVIQNDLSAFADATQKIGLRSAKGQMDYKSLLECYRHSICRMVMEDRYFDYSMEVVTDLILAYQKGQFGVTPIKSSPELLAQSRIFWGHNAILADMGCRVNYHRIAIPLLVEEKEKGN